MEVKSQVGRDHAIGSQKQIYGNILGFVKKQTRVKSKDKSITATTNQIQSI